MRPGTDGVEISVNYSSSNPQQISTVSTPSGTALTFTYNAFGDIEKVADPLNTWTYGYNSCSFDGGQYECNPYNPDPVFYYQELVQVTYPNNDGAGDYGETHYDYWTQGPFTSGLFAGLPRLRSCSPREIGFPLPTSATRAPTAASTGGTM